MYEPVDMSKCRIVECTERPTLQGEWKWSFEAGVTMAWCAGHAYPKIDDIGSLRPLEPLATVEDFWKELNS